jgi:hypothetical protein
VPSGAPGPSGPSWASSRTQAAASLDGVGPPALGRVSARTGTPVTATLAGLWPGLGTGDRDAHPPDGFAGQRLGYECWYRFDDV